MNSDYPGDYQDESPLSPVRMPTLHTGGGNYPVPMRVSNQSEVPHFATGGTINPGYGGGATYQNYIDQGQSPSASLGNFMLGTPAYNAALADSQAGGSSGPVATTGGNPPMADGSGSTTSGSGSGFTGTSFPGTTIGGYTIPGLNAGPLPTGSLPWGGQGNIPTGLNVNTLENQSANTINGLQNYASGFNRNLQGVYGSINSARSDALAREAGAQKNDQTRLDAQHLRDVYDPYFGKAGLPKPQEINPGVGTFGMPTGTASTSGVGVRWSLLSPEEQYQRLNQPLTEYESLIGKTASGVASQISDAMTNARNIISALKSENPSKTNPYGSGLVPSNQYPTGANLTPQQQATDDAALLKAEMALESGQTGSITLPSGLTVSYSGRKPAASTPGGGGGGGGTSTKKPSSGPTQAELGPNGPTGRRVPIYGTSGLNA